MDEHYLNTDYFGEISVSSDGNRIAIGEWGKSSDAWSSNCLRI